MKFDKSIKISLGLVALLWIITVADFLIPLDFTRLGIYPRTFFGLVGIVFSPFLHTGFHHVASNSIPLLILMTVMLSFYQTVAFESVFYMILFTDVLVWMLARPAYHVGASGLVYSLAAFLIAAGFFKRKAMSAFIAAAVALLYGGLVWGAVPGLVDWYISWEAHFFGATTGVYLAHFYKRKL